MIIIVGMYFLMAVTFIVAKYAVLHVQPLFFVGVRMLCSGFLLCSYCFLFRRSSAWPRRADIQLFGLGMLAHIYIPYITEFVALQCVTPAKTALFYNLSPFVTALAAYYVFSDRLTRHQIIGMSIGFVGFLPLLYAQESACSSWGALLGGISYAEILLLISVVSSVFGWMIMRALVKRGYSPIMVNGITMLGGGLASLGTSVVFGEWQSPLFTTPGALVLWISLGIVLGIISYNLYGHLLRHYSPTLLSFAGFTCPLFTAVLQAILLKEGVPIQFFITMVCVTLGLYIFYKDELKKIRQK